VYVCDISLVAEMGMFACVFVPWILPVKLSFTAYLKTTNLNCPPIAGCKIVRQMKGCHFVGMVPAGQQEKLTSYRIICERLNEDDLKGDP
jgi:hypothetical protein